MLRDYRPSKKPPTPSSKKNGSKKTLNLSQNFLVPFILVFIVIVLSVVSIKNELTKFYSLKENERVLLLKNQEPIAYLFFNVNNKQIIVTDLRQSNFDLDGFEHSASFECELNKNLFYAFLLDTVFDHSYEYTQTNLDANDLLTFFKDKRAYRVFLQDKELLWRQQKFSPKNSVLVEPIFDCPVAIINTTSEPGLANSLASMLEKSSFSIIKKDSNMDNLEQTKVFYSPSEESCGRLLEKLDKIFPPSLVSINETETLNHRAAMVIYLGRDLAELYNFFVSKNLKIE